MYRRQTDKMGGGGGGADGGYVEEADGQYGKEAEVQDVGKAIG